MPLHLNPNVRGKYIKIGEFGWVKVDDILNANAATDAQGRHLIVRKKGGGPPLIYRGKHVDHVRSQLTKEGVP